MIKLSILICSLHSRVKLLNRLQAQLRHQLTDEVEVIVETDSGEITTGSKRNILLGRATGEYCCFIDDDDLVSDTYVSRILEATKTNPDCVGFTGQITFASKNKSHDFVHSFECKSWYFRNNIYYRYPNHLNPIRTALAREVGFKDITVGEDKDFSDRLRPLLKNGVDIPKPHLYYYLTG